MNRIGYPLRAHLDESELGLGKLVRDLVEDQGVKRAHHSKLEFGKPAFVEEKIMHSEASRSRVYADRQIQPSGFFIQREKMRVAESLVSFEAAHKDTTGAVLFGEARLYQRFIYRQQRQHRHPTQPLRGTLPDIDEPAVVAPGYRQFQLRPARKGPQKNRRIEYLHIDVQLVHVLEAGIDIIHLPGFFRSLVPDISRLPNIHIVDQP